MGIQQIRCHLDEVLHFLEPYMSFVNCHMVNFLTDHLWDLHVPADIRNSIKEDSDIAQAIEVFWSRNNSAKYSTLNDFIKEAEKHYLENFSDLLLSKQGVQQLLNKNSVNILSIKEFMSEKKRHEVDTVAELVSDLIEFKKNGKEIYVVDAGDGKGYLSSQLALQNQIKVLGIDANEVNTDSARKRSEKLQRAWDGLTQRATLISQGLVPPRRGRKNQKKEQFEEVSTKKYENYKLLNEFINPDLDLIRMVRNNFVTNNEPIEICLCGLHTCGNLAPTCLKLFAAQKDVTLLCNVGCCYHLLKEEFSKDDFFANQKVVEKYYDTGFPMSKYLRSKEIKLGRNARMLASQSIHRTVKNKDLPSQSLLYRALLEVLFREHALEAVQNFQVGKIKNFTTFKEYVEKCDKKLNLNLSRLEDSVYKSLLDKYSFEANLLDLFYLIRMTFAPILETVILLDRLLFLKENSFDKSFIVALFDPVVSPRRFGIIALK